jgi:hypothetical protein
MKLRCPACGSSWSLDAVVAHDGAREAVLIALQMPAPIGKQLIQYVALFRPPKRDLSLDRLADLLGELLAMITQAQVTFDGRVWPAPQEVWPYALKEMLDQHAKQALSTPMKNHNYLLKIIVDKANKQEARQETQREERRRHVPEGKRSTSAAPIQINSIMADLKSAVGKKPNKPTE